MSKDLRDLKSYTIEFASWNNGDDDNLSTKFITYDTEEEALAVLKLCQDCDSVNEISKELDFLEHENPDNFLVEFYIHQRKQYIWKKE
jgi:hypothetical protein